jgi:hypothetical protein
MTDRGASPWSIIIQSFLALKGRQNVLLVQYQLLLGLCRPLGAFLLPHHYRGLTPPSVFFCLFETLTSRTTISVESESSVFVCFMNTDCTSPDFSVSMDKPFVLFVKFVVGPIFCFVSETLMDKYVGDKRRCFSGQQS